jgi:hypothetical protein
MLTESQTNGLISEVAGVNLVLFLFVMPWILEYLKERLHLESQVVNLRVIRGSLLILAFGLLLVVMAPTSVLLISGEPQSPSPTRRLMAPCLFTALTSIALRLAVAVYALGFGARATTLSLVTSWFPLSLRACLYSTVLLVELTGMLIGELFLQNMLALALTLPKFWYGVPFLCSGVSSNLFSSGSLRIVAIDCRTDR